MPVGSSAGSTSTTSAPTRLTPANRRSRPKASAELKPPQTGVPVPGAKAGSMQSMSNER